MEYSSDAQSWDSINKSSFLYAGSSGVRFAHTLTRYPEAHQSNPTANGDWLLNGIVRKPNRPEKGVARNQIGEPQ